MASGLYRFQSSFCSKIKTCIGHSTFHSSSLNSGCRTVTSIAFNTGFADDSFSVDKNQKPLIKPHDVLSLKERERGDWRNLTLEEKQTLYRMSFSQSFSEVIDQPADEWKIILASTFTAMGLMTLGMYIWMAQKAESTELFSRPISFQNEMTEEEKMNLRSLKNKESVPEK